jgi:hypothetical protein
MKGTKTMSTYNGWTNYETWAAKLWLDNEQGTYYEVTGKATEIHEEATEAGEEPGTLELADWLKDYVTGMMPEIPASLASDLLGAALSEIDWDEMAESYLADAKEEATP